MDADVLLRTLDARLGEQVHAAGNRPRLAAMQRLPVRDAMTCPLPADLPPLLRGRLELAGVKRLYVHQAEALERVRDGDSIVVSTGTASGKSLCYQLPLLERLLVDDKATALYLAPTKALAHDQLRALRAFKLPHVRAAAYDGDTPRGEREAIRRTANVVLTNPDMLHAGLLPGHRRWADFLHRLVMVVVDECHMARGVFGTHVAAVLRRLRRVCARYGTEPVFVLASATIGNPGEHARNLTGVEVAEILRDGSPRPPVTFALWEPPLLDADSGARRSTLAETADLLAGLVRGGEASGVRQTVAFVKSRKAAELVAAATGRLLGGTGLEDDIAAYRAGHLPEERREVERGLVEGRLRAVAATDALELGVDVGALDAVVIAGWPGTAASLWQQAGRAGRRGRGAVVAFVAADDPLDHYLLAHPEQLWGRPLEDAVVDVTNPHVLLPHLRCAAWELPLAADEQIFEVDLAPLLHDEAEAGRLRERGERWYWSGRGSPATQVSLRNAGGAPYQIADRATGALIGEVDEARAFRTVHPGAAYLHQGRAYRVRDLDLDAHVAVVDTDDGTTYTRPRSDTDVRVLETAESLSWGRCRVHRGRVSVTTRVLAYERREVFSDRSLGVFELDLPAQHLVTAALWLSVPDDVLAEAGLSPERVPGAAHAAEHAAIGLLPLFAMCDRWDIGGLSTAWHPDTGEMTIFVYDGYPGGAGITGRAFRRAAEHLGATLSTVAACRCAEGCPSCVQSPKCGNGNQPLDKAGAIALLQGVLLDRATSGGQGGQPACPPGKQSLPDAASPAARGLRS